MSNGKKATTCKRRKSSGKKSSQTLRNVNSLDMFFTKAAKKFVKAGGTKVIMKVLPYLLFGYFGDKLSYSYRVTVAPDFFNKLVGSLANLGVAFGNILPSFHPKDLVFGVVFGVGMRFVVYIKGKNAKKFRKGEEYGSARWSA